MLNSWQTLSYQIINYLAFAGHNVSVITTQFCCYSSKAAINQSKQVNKLVCYRLLPCLFMQEILYTSVSFLGFSCYTLPMQKHASSEWFWIDISKLLLRKGWVLNIFSFVGHILVSVLFLSSPLPFLSFPSQEILKNIKILLSLQALQNKPWTVVFLLLVEKNGFKSFSFKCYRFQWQP